MDMEETKSLQRQLMDLMYSSEVIHTVFSILVGWYESKHRFTDYICYQFILKWGLNLNLKRRKMAICIKIHIVLNIFKVPKNRFTYANTFTWQHLCRDHATLTKILLINCLMYSHVEYIVKWIERYVLGLLEKEFVFIIFFGLWFAKCCFNTWQIIMYYTDHLTKWQRIRANTVSPKRRKHAIMQYSVTGWNLKLKLIFLLTYACTETESITMNLFQILIIIKITFKLNWYLQYYSYVSVLKV